MLKYIGFVTLSYANVPEVMLYGFTDQEQGIY
jgi:hypothetical protein